MKDIKVPGHGTWLWISDWIDFGEMLCRPDFSSKLEVGDLIMVATHKGDFYFNNPPQQQPWKNTHSQTGPYVLKDKATGFVSAVYKLQHQDAMKFNMKNPAANEHNGFYYYLDVTLADGDKFAKVVISSTSCVSHTMGGVDYGLLIYKWEPCLA